MWKNNTELKVRTLVPSISHRLMSKRKPIISIQNIVASAGLGGYIDLEKCTYSLQKTMYEPEQFPGLIYRMDDPKVVILLFASGKLVCTGAKKEGEVHRAVGILQKTLEEKELISYEE